MVVEGISAHHLAGSISQVTSQVPHKLCFRGTRRIHTFGPKFLEQKLIRWSKLSSELRNCSATVSLPVFRRSTGARRSEQTIYSILHIPLSGGGGMLESTITGFYHQSTFLRNLLLLLLLQGLIIHTHTTD